MGVRVCGRGCESVWEKVCKCGCEGVRVCGRGCESVMGGVGEGV